MARRKSKPAPPSPRMLASADIEIDKVAVGTLWSGAGRLTVGSVVFLLGVVGAVAAGGVAVGKWHGDAAQQKAAEQHAADIADLQAKRDADVASLTAQRDEAEAERDQAIAARDKATAERDNAAAERDEAQTALSQLYQAKAKFATDFATRVMDPDVLALLRRHVAQYSADGFGDEQWLLASLLWQLKAQDGFAEFLAGKEALRVRLQFEDGGNIGFDWQEGRSAVTDVLAQQRGEYEDKLLTAVNESLNRYGFYPLAPDEIIVRGTDGGILVATPGY